MFLFFSLLDSRDKREEFAILQTKIANAKQKLEDKTNGRDERVQLAILRKAQKDSEVIYHRVGRLYMQG